MKDGCEYTFNRPQTAGACDFENWSEKQDLSIRTKKPPGCDIKAGDIVAFTFSHIGLATSGPDTDGYVSTIEGSTNNDGSREGFGVFTKKRHLSTILRSRIRVEERPECKSSESPTSSPSTNCHFEDQEEQIMEEFH